MLNEIKQVQQTALLLHSEEEVEQAIDNMATEINTMLGDRNPVLLCAMNGGLVTTGKLLTRLNFPLTVDAINASRYRDEIRGGEIKWLLKPATPLKDRTVLIVDDILDEGYTMEALFEFCQQQGASSIYTAVLIDKKLEQAKPISADFVGLEVEDHYLFGYGMDYKGYLRNAAGIYACKESS
ncbi:hypoxanthine-guanine phosphoribosyltransferase [Methylomarinum sp. Ch1-1]|uniref:Hypoxanthine-guanine phosphoribosyltransferase n=1 Tax=Methylomarinum roseum TaxID=3067653 RepID=A0AAU7NT23_9GAMM|nr:hypoxanthine-guanine phosphoribosyltransferase [Methylomarinum sp. Ch1-1]MDP4519838.1 hypoxanthine-guanine phosphoribosyltransferase [Methylomarinum sp. Ch1-1]